MGDLGVPPAVSFGCTWHPSWWLILFKGHGTCFSPWSPSARLLPGHPWERSRDPGVTRPLEIHPFPPDSRWETRLARDPGEGEAASTGPKRRLHHLASTSVTQPGGTDRPRTAQS